MKKFAAVFVCMLATALFASNTPTPSFSPGSLSAPGSITISVDPTGCNAAPTFPGAVITQVVGNGTTATVTLQAPQSYQFKFANITGTTHFNGAQTSLTWTDSSHFTFSSATVASDTGLTGAAAVYPYIYYTTNGTTPYPNFNLYTGPVSVSLNSTALKAIAVCPGFGMSAVQSVTYTFTIPNATVTPSSGSVTHGGTITFKCDGTGSCNNANAILYYTYTTDGSTPADPTTSSPNWGKQNVTFTIPSPGSYPYTLNLKVLTTAPGYGNSSVDAHTYTVN